MRTAWRSAYWVLLILIGITTVIHHPAAWPLSVIEMIMAIMSCLAELIKMEEKDAKKKAKKRRIQKKREAYMY